MCACDKRINSGAGTREAVSAGSTSRFNPIVIGPKFSPTRVLKTGSVRITTPSIFSSTVLCPSHAACSPASGHNSGRLAISLLQNGAFQIPRY